MAVVVGSFDELAARQPRRRHVTTPPGIAPAGQGKPSPRDSRRHAEAATTNPVSPVPAEHAVIDNESLALTAAKASQMRE